MKKEDILELFSKLKVEYLEDYIYEYNEVKSVNCYNSQYYLDNQKEFEDLTREYGDKIEARELADLKILKTDDRGYGLFADQDLKENDFIGVYLGVIRIEDEMVAYDETGFDTDYAWDFPDETLGLPNLEINAKYKGNELRFANHIGEPNLKVEHTVVNNRWYIFFLADRDIKKGEELTISYGEAYWDTDYRELV